MRRKTDILPVHLVLLVSTVLIVIGQESVRKTM